MTMEEIINQQIKQFERYIKNDHPDHFLIKKIKESLELTYNSGYFQGAADAEKTINARKM